MHGYNFHVLGSKSLGYPLDLSEIKDLDNHGKLSRNLEDPPRRDTVVIPNKGYAILRLITSNPGLLAILLTVYLNNFKHSHGHLKNFLCIF